jgi:hypothetical protein
MIKAPAVAFVIVPGGNKRAVPKPVAPTVMNLPLARVVDADEARYWIFERGVGPVNGANTVSGELGCPAEVNALMVPPPAELTCAMIVLFRLANPGFSPITNSDPPAAIYVM